MDPAGFLADLEAKPSFLRDLAATVDSSWAGVPQRVRRVVLVGMGSSRFAGLVAAHRLHSRGVDAVAEYASAASPFPLEDGTLVVAISATGGSIETFNHTRAYSRYVALTNAPGSQLAQGAATVVPMQAGVEAGGVACRTFTHTLALLLALCSHLTGRPPVADLVRRAADATEDLLERRDQWLPAVLGALDGPHGLYTLAPVERLSSALQSALMVREGPRRAATGCETGDWSHVDVYLTKTLDYRALLFPGSRYDGQALDWLRLRGCHGRGSGILCGRCRGERRVPRRPGPGRRSAH